MGWYFGNETRKDLIAELTKSGDTNHVLAHTARGNVLWTVNEVVKTGERWIGCYLMAGRQGSRDGWGYKPMEESMGPFYYTCPPSYLDMVPQVACANWREQVRKHHARVNRKLTVGDRIKLLHSTPDEFVIVSLKPLRGRATANGVTYRIPRGRLAEVTEVQP